MTTETRNDFGYPVQVTFHPRNMRALACELVLGLAVWGLMFWVGHEFWKELAR